MSIRRVMSIALIAAFALLGLAPLAASAQDATPVTGTPTTVIASGLTTPRGFTWGPDGAIYVALAGSGGTTAATENAPTTEAIGPFHGGPSAAVARIDAGCPVAVATGLPSTLDGLGEVLGAEDVAFLGGDLYVAVDGGGPVHGNSDQPAGVYKVNADGTASVIADLSAWLRANPVAVAPPDLDPDADGYRMVADETNGELWVLEPNSGGVLSVKPDGTIARIADLSEGHPVPSAIVAAPDGGAYVGFLTTVPFPDGAAKVVKVAADGTVSDVWTGLTMITGLAVGSDGSLYAAEMSTGNLAGPPFLVPGSGTIVRQTGASSSEPVATGLMFPVALGIGPDGGMYVSTPAVGSTDGSGMILRIGGSDAGAGASPVASPTACSPIPGTANQGPPPAPEGSPVATPVS